MDLDVEGKKVKKVNNYNDIPRALLDKDFRACTMFLADEGSILHYTNQNPRISQVGAAFSIQGLSLILPKRMNSSARDLSYRTLELTQLGQIPTLANYVRTQDDGPVPIVAVGKVWVVFVMGATFCVVLLVLTAVDRK